ncbi:uncharacterized protein BDW70DRAFT_148403 [Aspergillus foveolatus]|uniref:uncharacterized protein n=1 Tax=Aspergillus foveolatus TaxID=210207 RepID=UPI003CCE1DE7
MVRDAYPSNIRSFKGERSAREQRFIEDNIEIPYFCHQLFYVSRALSEDVRAAFYSSLRSICVTIGTTWCDGSHSPLVYRAHRRGCHGTVAEIMENDAQLAANGVLETWRSVCSTLAAYRTRDDQFELRLICGAASTETAAAFLALIHDLPRLKALSIRMGPNRNLDIQNMIMKIIRQRTKYFGPEPEGSFPFLKLPSSFNSASSNTPASSHPGISCPGLSTNAPPRSNAGSSNALGTQSGSKTVVITTVRLPIPLSPLPTPGIHLKCGTKNGACLLTPLGSSANSLLTRGNTCVMSAGILPPASSRHRRLHREDRRLVQQPNGAILLRSNPTFQFHTGTML